MRPASAWLIPPACHFRESSARVAMIRAADASGPASPTPAMPAAAKSGQPGNANGDSGRCQIPCRRDLGRPVTRREADHVI